jgi:hypothetical protein
VPFSVCEFRESNREMRVLGGRGFTVEREREVFRLIIWCKSCHPLPRCVSPLLASTLHKYIKKLRNAR